MNILLIGGGGRESALAYKLTRSPLLTKLMIYNGNPSMARFGSLVDSTTVDPTGELATQPAYAPASLIKLAEWSASQNIDLVISGPEAPICADIRGYMNKVGVLCFAPNLELSQLESSKQYAKQLMNRAGIPTATCHYATSYAQAQQHAYTQLKSTGGTVIKANGLASGKGVFVCHNQAEIDASLLKLQSIMGQASRTLLCEEVLSGYECSYFAMVNGTTIIPMGFVRDYKRLLNDDQGPNTGGMGAHTTLSHLPHDAEAQVHEKIMEPLLHTIQHQGSSYTGFLYIGLMWTEQGPYVLEYNIRLGDPECQVLTIADSTDWLESIIQIHETSHPQSPSNMTILREPPELSPTLGVVCASSNYPWLNATVPPQPLPDSLWSLPTQPTECWSFGAALTQAPQLSTHDQPTPKPPHQFYATQGRILTLVATAPNLNDCRTICYQHAAKLKQHWHDIQFRTDIGLNP